MDKVRSGQSDFSRSGLRRRPHCKVVKITDGNTLYVLDANYQQQEIHLAGIDAPERKQARKTLTILILGGIDVRQGVIIFD